METLLDKLVFDCEISPRKVLIVPVDTITHTPYNPSRRTKAGKALSKLIETIRVHGLQYPILITADRCIIDGNRRMAACKALGMTHIECLVASVDRDQLFTDLNGAVTPLGGKDWLEIGRGGGYLPPKEAAMYRELHDLVGLYGIDFLIRKNLGLNVLPLCKQVIHLGVRKSLAEVIMSAAMYKLTNKINTALRMENQSDEDKAAAIMALLPA